MRCRRVLAKKGLVVTTAESCTGGLISYELAKKPGASEVFWGGWVTYTVAAKTELLGVKSETIESRGVVSGEVAKEMATGALNRSGAHAAVSTTGWAGPDSGDGQPTGLVWIGLARRQDGHRESCALGRHFRGGRGAVQRAAAGWALDCLADWLEGRPVLDRRGILLDNNLQAHFEAIDPSFPPPPQTL